MTDYTFYEKLEDPTSEQMQNWMIDLTSDNKELKKILKELWRKYDCLVDWAATEPDLNDRDELKLKIIEAIL